MKKLIWLIILFPILFAGVEFDGADDSISIPDDNSIDIGTSDFTLAAWIKSDNIANYKIIFDKPASTGNAPKYQMMLNTNGRLCFYLDDGTGSVLSTDDGTVIDDAASHHVAVTFDRDGNAIRYVDGSPDGIADDISGVQLTLTNDGALYIGTRLLSADRFFLGNINEIAVWNILLTANEISLLANSRIKRIPLQIQPNNLVLYLPMDDEPDGSSADGDSFMDKSGNGNNGTGSDGANNTGCTAKAEEVLSYPGD